MQSKSTSENDIQHQRKQETLKVRLPCREEAIRASLSFALVDSEDTFRVS